MKKVNKECLYCLSTGEIKASNLWFMVAVDKPYYNLWFHRECYKQFTEEELIEFLQENTALWYK